MSAGVEVKSSNIPQQHHILNRAWQPEKYLWQTDSDAAMRELINNSKPKIKIFNKYKNVKILSDIKPILKIILLTKLSNQLVNLEDNDK